MALDLWFRADVARILQATHEAMSATAAAVGDGQERAAGYRQGFGAALRAVATAFGLTEYAPAAAPERWRVVAEPAAGRYGPVVDVDLTPVSDGNRQGGDRWGATWR